jgi:hypothetical protein
MALNKDEKHGLWIALVIAGLVVLYLLLRNRNTSGSTNLADSSVPYTTVNLSPGGYSGTATGLPTIPAATTSDCGCGGGATTGGFYASLNDMLQQFMAGATQAFNSYENNVYATQPNFVTQYFNNPVGVGTAVANQNVITGS